jgi:protein TonB
MVGFCAIAAALRLAAAIRVSRRRHYAFRMMRAPPLLTSIILHAAVVAAVAWWVPKERGGMPGDGGATTEVNVMLLDEPIEARQEEITAIDPASALAAEVEPDIQRVVDFPSPSVIASRTLGDLPAPAIGVEDFAISKPATASSRPPGRSRRSTAGLASSRAGGGGGSGNYTPPSYAHCPAPTYPPAARDAHQSGLALLRVKVGAHGAVVRVALTRSTGSRALDDAAIATVRKWRFVPARLDTKPVAADVEVPVRFVL